MLNPSMNNALPTLALRLGGFSVSGEVDMWAWSVNGPIHAATLLWAESAVSPLPARVLSEGAQPRPTPCSERSAKSPQESDFFLRTLVGTGTASILIPKIPPIRLGFRGSDAGQIACVVRELLLQQLPLHDHRVQMGLAGLGFGVIEVFDRRPGLGKG